MAKRKRKILYNAVIKPVINGWIVEIEGEEQHYYPSQKEWWNYDKADNERYFPTLKKAIKFLLTFEE